MQAQPPSFDNPHVEIQEKGVQLQFYVDLYEHPDTKGRAIFLDVLSYFDLFVFTQWPDHMKRSKYQVGQSTRTWHIRLNIPGRTRVNTRDCAERILRQFRNQICQTLLTLE